MFDPAGAAAAIIACFEDYRADYIAETRAAKERFEAADWQAVRLAAANRIELYTTFADRAAARLREEFDAASFGHEEWLLLKSNYVVLLVGREDADLAETAYNTVYRRLAGNSSVLPRDVAFVSATVAPAMSGRYRFTRRIGPGSNLSQLVADMLRGFEFGTPFHDFGKDCAHIVDAMTSRIPLLRRPDVKIAFEMVEPVFYRNKGAYLIGKMWIDEHLFPVAIPIQHLDEGGLHCDTVIWNENDLSMIFSFTRSYFMVDIERPADLVDFLADLLPAKKRWELYTSLGFFKHGKTEFYRGFLDHLDVSDDDFVVAEGIKGMVMAVFTLPSYQVVFKVIKDRFSPTKTVTREQVKAAYHLVKTHDRVGRMADTQEFSNFEFPRARFSDELIDYLQSVAASSVRVTDDLVIVSHLYTERLMTPLNIFIDQCNDFERRRVLEDYGNAIRQLAAANIFPGDMLLKNFGVTRHGRVVFYDYDEICYLTDVNFRRIPPPRFPEDEMAAEPWYSVGPNDVFPEEFPTFLFNSRSLRDEFTANHAEIFDAAYWQQLQENVGEQKMLDVFPYRSNRKFSI